MKRKEVHEKKFSEIYVFFENNALILTYISFVKSPSQI